MSTCIIPKEGRSGLLTSNIQITDRIIYHYATAHYIAEVLNLLRLVLQPSSCDAERPVCPDFRPWSKSPALPSGNKATVGCQVLYALPTC